MHRPTDGCSTKGVSDLQKTIQTRESEAQITTTPAIQNRRKIKSINNAFESGPATTTTKSTATVKLQKNKPTTITISVNK